MNTEEPNIYSSLSSSTSSVTTLDDDLNQELENMWKIRSPTRPIKSEVHQQDLFLQLLISQAVIDAREYKVLSFEEIETLKERREKLRVKVKNSASKLELDKKIQETSHSLSQLASNRQSILTSRDEALEADQKVDELSRQLKELKVDEIQTQYRILEHTAGVLCHGLQELERKRSSIPLSEIRSDQEQITENLIDIMKRHNVQYSSTDTLSLLSALEKHMQFGSDNANDLAQLRSLVTEMETQLIKIRQQASVFERQEQELKRDIENYREQVLTLRLERERHQKSLRRQTLVLENDGQLEQQLEEQEQEYLAQLKEQTALLDKTARECERMKKDHDALVATCGDLEWLVKDKARALEARDAQIAQLERELSLGSIGPLQREFSEKEHAWMEQSAALEANFEGILKEFDRLTGTAMEFESDKANYERRIDMLTREVNRLEVRLQEERANNTRLGKNKDTPTTAALRKEFRKIISDIQSEHQNALEKEAEEKKRLEKQLKDLKHEREMARYERINKGVQTPLFIS
ncbi:unnamed protein product [Rhizopus stolonifer]